MNTYSTSTDNWYGNRLTMGDLTVDIYIRDGVAWVTERRGSVTQTFTAGEWARMRRGAQTVKRAHDRAELGIESLLPEATIEAMHAARKARGPSWRERLVRVFGALRPAM